MVVNEKTLCSMLDLKPSTLKLWRKKRFIPYIKLGKSVRYDVDKVKAWLDVHQVEAVSP